MGWHLANLRPVLRQKRPLDARLAGQRASDTALMMMAA